MKKILLVFAMVLALSNGAFAGGTQEKGGAVPAGEDSTVTLRWLMQVASAEEARQWRALADSVTEIYPNIKIDMSTTDWNGYWTKLPTELAGGNPPDILYMQSLRAKDYLEAGFLPIDSFTEKDSEIELDDFYSGILEGLSLNGKLYCLPYDFGPYITYYNKDLFDKYGIEYPDTIVTLADFENLCKQFASAGAYGTVVPPSIDTMYLFFLGSGVDLFDDVTGKVKVNDPRIIEVLRYLSDLIKKGYAPRQTDTGNANWAREQFYAGSVAMYFDGPWNLTNIKDKTSFSVAAAMVPPGTLYRKSHVAGSGFGISKVTEHPEEAYKAIKVITGKEALQKLAEWGRALPARASVRDAYYTIHADVHGLKDTIEDSLNMEIGVPMITPQKWQEVNNTINQNMEGFFLGGMDVQERMDNAQKIIDRILGQ